jgi:hypothetical protein
MRIEKNIVVAAGTAGIGWAAAPVSHHPNAHRGRWQSLCDREK